MGVEPVEPPLTGRSGTCSRAGWTTTGRCCRRGGRLVACSLRWIYNHMIEEYAQHNGHADLIRELIGGTVSS